jgi:hypothetical protein
MRDLDELGGNYLSDMNIIALDAQGTPAGFTNESEGKFIYMRAEMSEPQRWSAPSRPPAAAGPKPSEPSPPPPPDDSPPGGFFDSGGGTATSGQGCVYL